jgi:CRP/FNR family cyclic AMP-dependent transcriptional regulator
METKHDFNQICSLSKSWYCACNDFSFGHLFKPEIKICMMIDIDILLAWGATYKKLAPGECIFREGSEGRFYHQLVSGSINWVNINDAGGEFLQDIIEPGESFGEFHLFDDSVYAASAIASKDSVIIRLNKATFQNMLKEHPSIHFAFTKLFTERLRFKFLLLKELSCFGPEHRISTLFSHFKAVKKNICDNCHQIKITRQQIADMTGLRVETVIRSIRHLQDKGALVINKGKVYC